MKQSTWRKLLALLAMVALVAAGCASDSTDASPTDSGGTTETTVALPDSSSDVDYNADADDFGAYAGLDKDLTGITINLATLGGQPYEAMYDSLSVFEEATGATVDIVFLGDAFEIDRYLKTAYATGTVNFDVAWNHTSFMAQFTSFVEDLNNWFTADEIAAFTPSIVESATIDGALQLIPRHADISSQLYRTDLFEDPALQSAFEAEFGYELAPPETLEQMKDMAPFFVDQGAVAYGTQFTGKEEAIAGRFYELLFANGGDYFDADLNPIFDSEAGRLSAQWMRDLYAVGAVPPDTPNLLFPEVAANFCEGKVAFYLEWNGWYSYFQDPESCPKVAGQFGVIRGPIGAGDVHTGWAGAHAFSIAKASENKEAAAQLLKFLTSERLEYDEAQLGLLPVRGDVWDRVQADAATSDVPLDAERLNVAVIEMTEDFRPPPTFPDWISFTDTWFPTLQAIVLGDLTVDEGLAKGVEDARQLLDGLGYYDG